MRKLVIFSVLNSMLVLGAWAQGLPAEVEAWLASPIVTNLKAAVTAEGNGFKVEIPGTGLAGSLFKTAKGQWVAGLGKTNLGEISLSSLPGMGEASITGMMLFLSPKATKLTTSEWPSSGATIAKSVSDSKGNFDLGEGLTLAASLKAGSSGIPGMLATAFGLTDGKIGLGGGFGPEIAGAILPSLKGDGSGRGADLMLVIPGKVVPLAFQDLPSSLSSKYGLYLQDLVLKLTWALGTVSLAGSGTGRATLDGTKVDFGTEVTLSNSDGTTTLSFKGDSAISGQNLLGIKGLSLTSLGIQAQVSAGKGPVTGSFGISTGMTLPGGATTKGFAFIEKTATTPSASIVMQVNDLDLGKLAGANVDLPALPKAVVFISTAARGTVSGNTLPFGAQDLLKSADWPVDLDINLPAGVAIFSALKPSTSKGNLAKLASFGLSGTYLLAGSLGWDGSRKPMLDLAAVLPNTPALPGFLGNLKFGGAQPVSLFISLGADATSGIKAGVGLRGSITVNLPTKVVVGGKLSLNLSPSSGLSGSFSGQLLEDWPNSFGLKDISMLKDSGMALAIEATGAATFVLDGRLAVGGVDYGAGGGVSLLFSTGLPVVKGLALRLSAQSLDLLTPVRIGQTVVKAILPMVDNIVPRYKTDLAKAANIDFVKSLESIMPKSGPVAEMARFTVKDALLFIATPGMDLLPGFDDVGLKINGTLYRDGARLGGVGGGLTAKIGLQLKGDMVDVPMGIVTLKKPMVDIAVNLSSLPHFFFKGAAEIEDLELASLDCGFSSAGAYLDGSIDLGDLGATANVKGAITGPRSVSLSGAATLNPPNIDGVNLPSLAVSFSFDGKKLGFSVSGDVGWEKAKFKMSGWYKKSNSWSIGGSASVDDGSKSFEIDDVKIASIKVAKKGGISLSLSPGKATVKASGEAKITVLAFPGFKGFSTDWDFDQELSTDLKIKKTIKVFNPIKLKEENFTINYRIFP